VIVCDRVTQLAKDLREGSALAPGFETALRRHRLPAAIERSSALGARQSLESAVMASTGK